MNKNNTTQIQRIIKAFGYSFAGLKSCFKTEAAFRQELFLAVIFIPIACLLDVPTASKALMVGSIFLILIAELINTSIEAVVDRVSKAQHKLSKKAKDVGSAVVLMAFINAACIWGIVLIW